MPAALLAVALPHPAAMPRLAQLPHLHTGPSGLTLPEPPAGAVAAGMCHVSAHKVVGTPLNWSSVAAVAVTLHTQSQAACPPTHPTAGGGGDSYSARACTPFLSKLCRRLSSAGYAAGTLFSKSEGRATRAWCTRGGMHTTRMHAGTHHKQKMHCQAQPQNGGRRRRQAPLLGCSRCLRPLRHCQ